MSEIHIHRLSGGEISEVVYTFIATDLTEPAVVLSGRDIVIHSATSSIETTVEDLPALILALEHARDEALDQYVYTQKNGASA